jgi:hypothetical protein
VKAERRRVADVGRAVCSEEPRVGVADESSVEAQARFTKRLCRFMAIRESNALLDISG